jgi:ParB-like chromosome segregation protein Spo0J
MASKKQQQKDGHRQHEGQGKHKASLKRGNTTLALQYAQEGVPVVPLHGINDGHCTCGDDYCDRSGKHPRTKRGIKDATTDPAEIERLWAKRPKAKIGIVMGGPGKVVALRTEGQTGRQSLRAITVRNGKLPETVTIRDHDRRLYLFRVHENQSSSRKIADGVRVLGDGKFIVAPRLDSSTNARRFAKGLALGEIEIARAPDWLTADLTSAKSEEGQADPTINGNKENVEDKLGRATAEPLPFHPFANIFPMLAEERLHELAQDIKDRGLLDPITLYEGQILDGRGRYRACKITAVQPKFEDYVGDDALSFVVSRNLHRRHLTESQRAMVAARLADLKRGANQHSQGLPIGRAADLLNVGERTVARARKVLSRGVPDLLSAVERGEVAVSAATNICGMSEAKQREMVASVPDTRTPDAEGPTKNRRKRAKREAGGPGKEHAASVGDMVPAAEAERLRGELATVTERLRRVEQELENERVMASRAPAVDASMKAPTDLDIPPFLDRRPLLPDDQLAFDAIKAAWANSTALRATLVGASTVVRERFIAVLRADIAK